MSLVLHRHSEMVTDFVPADEFLEYLQATQLMDDGGVEPSIDVTLVVNEWYVPVFVGTRESKSNNPNDR